MSCLTDQTPPCPFCDGPGMLLGQLGGLVHWACRDCAHQFHTPADHDDQDGDYPDW